MTTGAYPYVHGIKGDYVFLSIECIKREHDKVLKRITKGNRISQTDHFLMLTIRMIVHEGMYAEAKIKDWDEYQEYIRNRK